MNEKEVAEIRRRFRANKSGISHIRGCCVNEKGEIASEFDQHLALTPEAETEKLLATLKRTLSGTLNKNLMEIAFSTQQVVQSEEHRLLMALRESALKDEDAVRALFERVIEGVAIERNYLILLAYDAYDVPYRSADGQTQQDASNEVFSYVLCSVCPVKQTKPALSYYMYENEFHSLAADWVVSPPELGFMFPAFDDRSTNIYSAMYYTKDTADSHQAFVDAVFKQEAPMPAATQKDVFGDVLGQALAEECSYDVVQAVHGQLQGMIEEHKLNKEEQPLMVSRGTVKRILGENGVSEQGRASFEEKYETAFGADAELSPKNIVDEKKIEITTTAVTIQVEAGYGDLVDIRRVDGTKYIMIRADEGAQVNGVPVQIP